MAHGLLDAIPASFPTPRDLQDPEPNAMCLEVRVNLALPLPKVSRGISSDIRGSLTRPQVLRGLAPACHYDLLCTALSFVRPPQPAGTSPLSRRGPPLLPLRSASSASSSKPVLHRYLHTAKWLGPRRRIRVRRPVRMESQLG